MKTRNIFMYVLGVVIVTGFFLLLYFLVYNDVPTSNADILNITVGALISSFASVVGYFYGSSKGSADKTDLIANGKKDENKIG
jgi:drug/metabolite transporter (DMT)-like permease